MDNLNNRSHHLVLLYVICTFSFFVSLLSCDRGTYSPAPGDNNWMIGSFIIQKQESPKHRCKLITKESSVQRVGRKQNTFLIVYLQGKKEFFKFLFFGPKLKHLLLKCNSLQLSTISHILQNQLLLNLGAFSKICGFSLLSFLA